jgi:ribosomal protein S18 acetylase RimI-like enzyme
MTRSVVVLSRHHDVTRFDCGTEQLNHWLRTVARQHQSKSLSGTFVLVDDDKPSLILGYYALNIRTVILADQLPAAQAKKLPRDIPGLTIGRLAVSAAAKGQGLGEQLLVDAMTRAKQVSRQVGGALLFVDAKDVGVAAFYLKYGFRPLPSDPLTLCMKISDIP